MATLYGNGVIPEKIFQNNDELGKILLVQTNIYAKIKSNKYHQIAVDEHMNYIYQTKPTFDHEPNHVLQYLRNHYCENGIALDR